MFFFSEKKKLGAALVVGPNQAAALREKFVTWVVTVFFCFFQGARMSTPSGAVTPEPAGANEHARTDVGACREEIKSGDEKRCSSGDLDSEVGVTRLEPVKYSDCVIRIGGRDAERATHTYHCHRAVVARGSRHLAALFDSGETNVHLGDGLAVPMRVETMGVFVRLLYDADLHESLLTSGNVRAVCELADYLDAPKVVKQCDLRLSSMHGNRRGPGRLTAPTLGGLAMAPTLGGGPVATAIDLSSHKFRVGSFVLASWRGGKTHVSVGLSYTCVVLGHNADLT